jgi:NADH-quinone oxidoreductase subunit J
MPMTMDMFVFFVLALIAIASAVGMLVSRNGIYAALFLVLNFMTVAIFYLLLGAPFIALSQVTVYAGAIMVLFLFVIMLLGAEKLPPTTTLPYQRYAAYALGGLLLVELGYWVWRGALTGLILPPPSEFNTMASIDEMSRMLFSKYLLPFEVTSILLLVAMIGAIVLTIKQKGGRG